MRSYKIARVGAYADPFNNNNGNNYIEVGAQVFVTLHLSFCMSDASARSIIPGCNAHADTWDIT